MTPMLDDRLMEKVSRHVADCMGLNFPPSRWHDLERAFGRAASELGFRDAGACIDWFLCSPPAREIIQSLSSCLTIGETYFMREMLGLEALEQQIIPDIVKQRRGAEKRLRIWSAGCATGEEPYTIAVLLDRMGERLRGWDMEILATDINPDALGKAKEGEYSQWSFRNAPAWLKQNYFNTGSQNRLQLIPRIRSRVHFSYLNLAEDFLPLPEGLNDMDVIVCRNVLMYFTPDRAEKVLGRFSLCLRQGGWLIVSPCDLSASIPGGFAAINFGGALLYQKRETGSGADGRMCAGLENVTRREPPLLPAPAPVLPMGVSPIRGQSKVREQVPRQETSEGLKNRCRACADEGRLDEALQLSEKALAADKLDAGLHYLRAVILLEQGLLDEATASLKRTLYLDPDLVMAHFTLGNLALRQGHPREARKCFENALAILDRYDPEDMLPESDGIVAGRLAGILRSTTLMT